MILHQVSIHGFLFFEFFLYQEFDEIFPQKLSKVVEVTLEGKKLINS